MSSCFALSRRATGTDAVEGEAKAEEESKPFKELMHSAAAADIALRADKVSSLFMLFLHTSSASLLSVFLESLIAPDSAI